MPVIDGGVELDARIGAGPGGVADLVPQVARFQRLDDIAFYAPGQIPVAIAVDGLQEFIGNAYGVVRVLAGDCSVRLRIPIGIVGIELDVLKTLFGELDDALDDVVVDQRFPGRADFALERRVLGHVEAGVGLAFAVHAGLHDGLEVPVHNARARHQGGDLLLFLHFPVDIALDIGVIDIDHHHFRRAPRGAARLDRARRPVADFQEAHEAGRPSAAGQFLALST